MKTALSVFVILSLFLSLSLSQFTTSYSWDPIDGDGKWTDPRWSFEGFPNSNLHEASVDVEFSVGTVTLDESVTVTRLVVGPGCTRLQITEVPEELSRLTVETHPSDNVQIELSGSQIEQPIKVSLSDPALTGRTAIVSMTTELTDEVKTFQLTRNSPSEGWFYGTFMTRRSEPCPEDATTLCLNDPQEIFASYVSLITENTHTARVALGCGDYSEFTVEEVEWALTSKAVNANYKKLWDLYMRLLKVQSTLSLTDYVENVNYYKSIAQESFLLGSTCLEDYCESTEEFLTELCNEGATIKEGTAVPLTRIIDDEEEI